MLGLAAFALKGRALVGNSWISSQVGIWLEVAIGLSLVAIGVLGLGEEAEPEPEASSPDAATGGAVAEGGDCGGALSAASADTHELRRRSGSVRAIWLNGLLHGASWDGAPSFAPALALPSAGACALFLTAYNLGTIVAMSVATTLIGEGSRRAAKRDAASSADLPKRLSVISSCLAILVGVVWTAKGVVTASRALRPLGV